MNLAALAEYFMVLFWRTITQIQPVRRIKSELLGNGDHIATNTLVTGYTYRDAWLLNAIVHSGTF